MNVSQVFFEALQSKLYTSMGAIVETGKWQLRGITLPDTVQTKFKNVFIQTKTNEQKVFELTAAVIRKQTELLQQQIYANITITNASAEAKYFEATNSANADVDRSLKIADGEGLARAFRTLGWIFFWWLYFLAGFVTFFRRFFCFFLGHFFGFFFY